jgi:hypothetical protein
LEEERVAAAELRELPGSRRRSDDGARVTGDRSAALGRDAEHARLEEAACERGAMERCGHATWALDQRESFNVGSSATDRDRRSARVEGAREVAGFAEPTAASAARDGAAAMTCFE